MGSRGLIVPFNLVNVTTTQRDALPGVTDGDVVYNATAKRGEIRASGLWVPLSGLLGGTIGLYTFSTTTTDSDPGPGVLRLNNATQPSATEIIFDPVDLNGTDLSTPMQYLYSGTGNDIFRITSVADPTKYLTGFISGFNTPTGYAQFFVGVLDHHGTFTNGELITLTGARAGGTGANGTDGVTGFGLAGDGSDGVVNFDGTNTRLGLVPASGVYSLNRDIFLADGSQISSTAKIKTRNWRIFCSGTFTIGASANLNADGGDAPAAPTGGAGTGSSPNAFYPAAGNGGAGKSGTAGAGTAGTAETSSIGGAGGAGGIASGSGTGGGAAGGTVTAVAANDALLPHHYIAAITGYNGIGGNSLRGGAGGGGGTNTTSSTGGGGGGGGGIVLIVARVLVNNGTITSKGGAGAAATGTGTGGGGGGGGGAGAVIVVCGSTSTIGTLTVTGGTGGARQGVGANGAAGSAGQTFTLNV